MIFDKQLIGKNIVLRNVELADCKSYYLDWLNDKEVNQYLETRWSEQSLESIKDFVQQIRESNHSYLFAIIYNNNHIGNIKLGPIHPIYKFADVSYFIGDKNCWGKGIATEAIGLVVRFAFEELNLHRVEAGAFAQNIGSQKALLANGFEKEATYRKRSFLEKGDDYCDTYWFALLKDDWRNRIKRSGV